MSNLPRIDIVHRWPGTESSAPSDTAACREIADGIADRTSWRCAGRTAGCRASSRWRYRRRLAQVAVLRVWGRVPDHRWPGWPRSRLADTSPPRRQATPRPRRSPALPARLGRPHLLAADDTAAGHRRRHRAGHCPRSTRHQVLLVQADVDRQRTCAPPSPRPLRASARSTASFHALASGVGLMQLKTPGAAAAVLAPRCTARWRWTEAVRDRALDCLVLFSSVTSVTGGGPGQADYCAANAFWMLSRDGSSA